jgi:hypothetical protein
MPWICAFLVLFVATPTSAYAYLDPGTGTVLLQGAIAGVAGALLVVRTYWARITGLFRGSEAKRINASERFPEDHA